MPRFKFRLATLLRLREAARDERRVQLAEAYRVDDVLRQRLEGVGQELGWLRNLCRRVVGPGTVDVDRLVEAQRYELVLRAQQHQLQQQREAVAGEIERRRQTLVEANREVRVLEKLREKQSLRHDFEENRQEIKRLDEVAQHCAGREDAP
jgi:flagellar export protein FliJ